MKQWIRAHWGLWILALGAAAIAAVMLLPRAEAERADRTYEIVADYSSYAKMAPQSGHDMAWWMDWLHQSGVQTVALYECSLRSLSNNAFVPVDVWEVGDLRKSAGWNQRLPEMIVRRVLDSQSSYDMVVACYEADDMDWILDNLQRRLDRLDYTEAEQDGTRYLFVAAGDNEDLQRLSLGFWPEMVQDIQGAGMTVLPRTTPIASMNGMRFLNAVLESFESVNPNPAYFYNAGKVLPGYDEPEQAHDRLLSWLGERGTALVVAEKNDQRGNDSWPGFDQLCQELDGRVIRAFYEWNYIQYRWAYYGYEGPEEIINSLYRAVVERNCRLVYLQAILDTDSTEDYITDPEAHAFQLTELNRRLEGQGMHQGTVSPMQSVQQRFVLRWLLGVGAVAAAVLLLCAVWPLRPRWQWLLTGAGALCVLGAMVVLPEGSKLILSIGAGIVYPSLSMLCLLRWLRGARPATAGRIWTSSILGMLLCVLGALCAAVATAAALSETAYMLEFRVYRAVKLMQILPIGVYALGYLLFLLPGQLGLQQELDRQVGSGRGAWGRFCRWFGRKLEHPVKLRWVVWGGLAALLAGVAGLVGLYYIARTGNSQEVRISALELMLRNDLEELLIARPRTKEFLIGVPCLMLFIYMQRRQWRLMPFFVGLGMAIGMTSFVNTFLHIRSPLYLGFARTGYAVLFGLLIGAAVIAVLEIVRAVRRKVESRRV